MSRLRRDIPRGGHGESSLSIEPARRDARRGECRGFAATSPEGGHGKAPCRSNPRDATRGGVNVTALPRHPPEGGHGKAPYGSTTKLAAPRARSEPRIPPRCGS